MDFQFKTAVLGSWKNSRTGCGGSRAERAVIGYSR